MVISDYQRRERTFRVPFLHLIHGIILLFSLEEDRQRYSQILPPVSVTVLLSWHTTQGTQGIQHDFALLFPVHMFDNHKNLRYLCMEIAVNTI